MQLNGHINNLLYIVYGISYELYVFKRQMHNLLCYAGLQCLVE